MYLSKLELQELGIDHPIFKKENKIEVLFYFDAGDPNTGTGTTTEMTHIFVNDKLVYDRDTNLLGDRINEKLEELYIGGRYE